MSHKKQQGSTYNLRDSNPQYRGIKLFGGQKATAGNIVVRQQGEKYVAGKNTYMTHDFTIHARVDGAIKFFRKRRQMFNGRRYTKTFVTVE